MTALPNFSTYIITDWNHTVLYTGMTNHLGYRLVEHWLGKANSFTTRYMVCYLLWHEDMRYVLNAIAREKEIKTWIRAKKEELISSENPDWLHLNVEVLGNWPPTEVQIKDTLEWRRREEEHIRNRRGK